MEHFFWKILVVVVLISLFMASTGFGTKMSIRLALAGRRQFDSGDAGDALVTVEKEIKGSGNTDLYARALRLLQERKLSAEKELTTAFKDQYRINSITESEGTVTVDFSSRDLCGSAEDEELLIAQIVETLTGSFTEVERVYFTVDGEPAQTLMGHVSIGESFSCAAEVMRK